MHTKTNKLFLLVFVNCNFTCCFAVAAEALERGNLARDNEKQLQRMEQECAHRIRAAERKMAKG